MSTRRKQDERWWRADTPWGLFAGAVTETGVSKLIMPVGGDARDAPVRWRAGAGDSKRRTQLVAEGIEPVPVATLPEPRRACVEQVVAWLDAAFDGHAPGQQRTNPGGPAENAVISAALAAAGLGRLSLDVVGTPFQRSVWAVLVGIPRGETMTYGEVAAALGKPSAARAVGAACGANHLPILIPCHRVVATGGGLGGFSAAGGVSIKERLLTWESLPARTPAPVSLFAPA